MINLTNEEFQKLVLEQLGNLKGQLDETNGIVRTLLHRAEELDAKFDGVLHTTASKESAARLDTKLERIAGDVNFLVRKSVEHEDDIRNLRLIK